MRNLTAEQLAALTPGKDDLCTPGWVLDVVRKFGRIQYDPCGNPWSKVGAVVDSWGPAYGEDGLATDWATMAGAENYSPYGVIFVNCPYSNPLPWIEKAVATPFANIITLTFLDPSTKWGRLMSEHAHARCEISRRVRHDSGGAPSEHGSPKPSALHYFGSHGLRFMRVCVESQLGPCIDLRKHLVHTLEDFNVR
jgi:hypothetical protein